MAMIAPVLSPLLDFAFCWILSLPPKRTAKEPEEEADPVTVVPSTVGLESTHFQEEEELIAAKQISEEGEEPSTTSDTWKGLSIKFFYCYRSTLRISNIDIHN